MVLATALRRPRQNFGPVLASDSAEVGTETMCPVQ
jgi:hypothetical protein